MRVLVDTGVWSHHFRERDPRLVTLLEERRVVTHPWVIGELALGPGLRRGVLGHLTVLPGVPVVPDDRLLSYVKLHRLRGIGWVDAQLLLASLEAGVELWTTDVRLAAMSEQSPSV